MFVGRVVRAHGVHVHRADQFGVLPAQRGARRPAAVDRKGVAVDAFHHQLAAVEVDAVLRHEFYRAESHARLALLDRPPRRVEQFETRRVEVGGLRSPEADAGPCAFQQGFGAPDRHRRARLARRGHDRFVVRQVPQRETQCVAARVAFQLRQQPQAPVVRSVEQIMADVGLRHDFQPHGAVDAAVEPPVGLAFGRIDALVVRVLGDPHLQQVAAPGPQQVGDVVAEAVESAPVDVARPATVDHDFGVGHHAVEKEPDALSAPCRRNVELPPVDAFFGAGLGSLDRIPAAVGVVAEALQLPVAGHADRAPRAAVLPRRAAELPGYGGVDAAARKVDAFGMGRLRGGGAAGEQQQKKKPAYHVVIAVCRPPIRPAGNSPGRNLRSRASNRSARAVRPWVPCPCPARSRGIRWGGAPPPSWRSRP